jgi:hypothetical protein
MLQVLSMARRACAAVPATALLLLALVAGASAITCAPGEGVAQTNVLSFLGALFGGKAPTEQPARCSPCGRNEASRGGEGAVCEMCAPTLAAPNTDHTACECLPGTYTATAASDTTVQRTCIACGHHAVSNRRNAGSCTGDELLCGHQVWTGVRAISQQPCPAASLTLCRNCQHTIVQRVLRTPRRPQTTSAAASQAMWPQA